jgi:arylsulfatase A-like enzyme
LNRDLFAIFVVLAASVLGTGCRRRQEPPPTPPSQNVLLILLDTVRVDRLGCYRSPLGLTPQIDRFASQAVRFERAFAHAPWTLPSVASLLTSRYPQQHGAGGRLGAFTRLSDEAVTVAEVFQRAGAATGAITNVFFLTQKFGTTQGFDTVDADASASNVTVRRAGPTTDAALEWIDGHRDKPFFLMVHYFDPHLAYDPPHPFRGRLADPQDRYATELLFGTVGDMIAFRRGHVTLSAEKIARLEKLYNGEVAYMDQEVGRLLVGMSERGLTDETIVVITADHGEEFLDHDGFEHGHAFYDELLRVPLLIRGPGFAQIKSQVAAPYAGRTVGSTVRLIDIAPTLCELAGVQTDPSFAGHSLAPLLRGEQGADRPVLSQSAMWGPQGEAWLPGGMKLIRRRPAAGEPSFLLFDIRGDPGERVNLAASSPDLRRRLAEDLDRFKRSIAGQPTSGDVLPLTPAEIERLRALGYVPGAADEAEPDHPGNLPDESEDP